MDQQDRSVPPTRVRPAARKSLYRALADGSGGTGVRFVISLAALAYLAGLDLLFLCLLSCNYQSLGTGALGRRNLYVPFHLLSGSLVIAGVLWLALLACMWSRSVRTRGFWVGVAATLSTSAVATMACLVVVEIIGLNSELVILGIVFLGVGTTLMLWLLTWRGCRRGRPPFHPDDGIFDVRCPNCGYRMVGLTQARCPECGTEYTLEELLAKQGFEPAAPAAPSGL